MEVCIKCQHKATFECNCSVFLCNGHIKEHREAEMNHIIGKVKSDANSNTQKNISKGFLSQLKVLDQSSHQVISASNILIQEIQALTKESLEKTKEQRSRLLNSLEMSNKKITAEENKYLKELFFAWDSEHEE